MVAGYKVSWEVDQETIEGNEAYFIKGHEHLRDNFVQDLEQRNMKHKVVELSNNKSVYSELNYPTLYALFRLTDGSHVERMFQSREDLREFKEKWKDHILPFDSEIIDIEKEQKQRKQEIWGYVFFGGIALFILYHIFT